MKKLTNRLLSLLLAASMVFSMAACGDEEETKEVIENTPEVTVEQPVETPSKPEEPAKPQETVKEELPKTETTTPAVPTETQSETPATPAEPPKEPAAPVADPKPAEPVVEETPENSTFSIRYLNVGQADAALVE